MWGGAGGAGQAARSAVWGGEPAGTRRGAGGEPAGRGNKGLSDLHYCMRAAGLGGPASRAWVVRYSRGQQPISGISA